MTEQRRQSTGGDADGRPRRSHEPHETATEIANEAIEAVAHHEAARVVVMVYIGGRGGVGLHGYGGDGDLDAMADVFTHLAAVFEANGKKLMIAPLGGDG